MLVLSRKRNEIIEIGESPEPVIFIHVIDIRGDKCRLGIEAPRTMPVHRREVAEAIRTERLAHEARAKK